MTENEPGQPPITDAVTWTRDLDVPASALAIGAHPDDVEFGCVVGADFGGPGGGGQKKKNEPFHHAVRRFSCVICSRTRRGAVPPNESFT